MGERNKSIDFLKGFCITLVVIGHVIQYETSNYKDNLMFCAIYAFHMPLFFFLSGYVSSMSRQANSLNDAINLTKRKATNLLVPLASWSVIHEILTFGSHPPSEIPQYLISQIWAPSLWFLHTLFIIFALKYAIELLLLKLKKLNPAATEESVFVIAILSIAILSKITRIENLLSFALNFSFFSLGYFAATNNYLIKIYKGKITASISLIALVVLMLNYEFKNQATAIQKTIKLGASLCATNLLYWASHLTRSRNVINDTFTKIGNLSLGIYVTHMTLIQVISLKIPIILENSLILKMASVAALTLMWICACMIATKAASKYKILNFFLYGKSRGSSLQTLSP